MPINPKYPQAEPAIRCLGGSWSVFLCFLICLPLRPLVAGPIDDIVGKIAQTEYASYVQNLQNFNTRYYNTQGNADALAYIHDAFVGFGLNATYDSFNYNGGTYDNVVATLPGKAHPENVYIVGAHMDSTSNDAANNAPGADDNASGMAAVMEMAKAMAGYAFDATIKFFGFNAEEQGLVGSKAYADKAIASGEHVLGMLNFDMISYAGGGSARNVFLAGNGNLVDAMASNALKYTTLNTTLNYGNIYGSDHYFFHSSYFNGSTSAFAIEAAPADIRFFNPNYHKTSDTTAYLDFGYATDVTRMGAATLAGLAGVLPEPSTLFCFLSGIIMLMLMHNRRLNRK